MDDRYSDEHEHRYSDVRENRYSDEHEHRHSDEHNYKHSDEHEHKKLSNGAIAGIVVACIMFIGIICLILWLAGVFSKKKSGGTPSGGSGGSGSSGSSTFHKVLKGAQAGMISYNLYGLYNKVGGGTGLLKAMEDGMKGLFKMLMIV
jgi:hypothetical protein